MDAVPASLKIASLATLELNLPNRCVIPIATLHMENQFCHVNAGSRNLYVGLPLIL